MKTWSEVEELPKYYNKALTLNNTLVLAGNTVDAFNVEENSFKWNMTAYPARVQIMTTLKPFLTLYEMSTEFLNKSHKWLRGSRSDIEPDAVEQVCRRFEVFKIATVTCMHQKPANR